MVQVRRQVVDCEAIARVRWPDCELAYYDDNDTSAYQPRARRASYQRMLADIAAGRVGGVVAWNLDRLLRQPRELEGLIDLGAVVVTAQGDLDLTTHDGQLHARILVAVAKKSSDDTSRRVARAAKDRAEAGRFHGARYVPYGLARQPDGTYTVDPSHAQIIGDVAWRVLAGESLTSIVASLQPPAPQTRTAWRTLLTGPTIRGLNRAGYPATWQPIVDPVTAAALHGALATRTHTRPNKRWPLSPVLRCGVCNGNMVGAVGETATRNRPYYGCRNGRCTTISAPHLETYVDAALDTAVVVVPREVVVQRDVRREQAMEHLAGEYASGLLARGEWEAARRTLAQSQPSHDRSLRHDVGDVPGPLLGQFPTDDRVDNRQQIGGWRRLTAIDHILIDKARAKGVRFDVGRVHIFWRN